MVSLLFLLLHPLPFLLHYLLHLSKFFQLLVIHLLFFIFLSSQIYVIDSADRRRMEETGVELQQLLDEVRKHTMNLSYSLLSCSSISLSPTICLHILFYIAVCVCLSLPLSFFLYLSLSISHSLFLTLSLVISHSLSHILFLFRTLSLSVSVAIFKSAYYLVMFHCMSSVCA